MPTGYTAKLMEEGQSFSDFIMLCARAFGAAISMKEDSLETPIPEAFQPSAFYRELIDTAAQRKAELDAMTSAERIAFGEQQRQKDITSCDESIRRLTVENARLKDMEIQVRAWEPPSTDHTGLKDFMLEQIRVCLHDSSYTEQGLKTALEKSPCAYYSEAVLRAEHDIEYYAKEEKKEIERVAGRNKWVRQLRDSLTCLT